MKTSLSIVLSLYTLVLSCVEPAKQPEKLQDPFHCMSITDQEKTGIKKLTAEEQQSLAKWWYQQKAIPFRYHVSKEVTVTAIENNGQKVVFDDGSSMIFTPSKQKKTAKWAVGDLVGFGDVGKKGAISLIHLPSGTKVRGKMDQSPVMKETVATQSSEPKESVS